MHNVHQDFLKEGATSCSAEEDPTSSFPLASEELVVQNTEDAEIWDSDPIEEIKYR